MDAGDSQESTRIGASCFLTVLRAGVHGVYTFSPGATTPWIGAGLGYEWSFVRQVGFRTRLDP